jgi:hypothetical protein
MSVAILFALAMSFWFCGVLAYYKCREWPEGYNTIAKVMVSASWLGPAGMCAGRWAATQPQVFEDKPNRKSGGTP